jgi:hypothetical protein
LLAVAGAALGAVVFPLAIGAAVLAGRASPALFTIVWVTLDVAAVAACVLVIVRSNRGPVSYAPFLTGFAVTLAGLLTTCGLLLSGLGMGGEGVRSIAPQPVQQHAAPPRQRHRTPATKG